MTADHLHRDETPLTLAVLDAVVGHHSDREDVAYSPDQHGAEVDWDRLSAAQLSSTEIATIHIAQGCAILERRGGGLPQRLGGPVRAAIEATTALADRPAHRHERHRP